MKIGKRGEDLYPILNDSHFSPVQLNAFRILQNTVKSFLIYFKFYLKHSFL